MISIPRGTKDVLPSESHKWRYLESKIRVAARNFGFGEIRTPIFEHTELFRRGVGDGTDIVNKEMYTFDDKGGRSISLKPEGTAGAVRSYIENGLYALPQPVKVYYVTPVFRYEKPQSGRLREHHQFGAEIFGSASPRADFEIISLAIEFLDSIGLRDARLNLNSIGCKACRARYESDLAEHLRKRASELCPACRERMEKNPLRALDCKNAGCRAATESAPRVSDYLCADCRAHRDELRALLDASGIRHVMNDSVARGLDYYTGTVFEFCSDEIGAQSAVCGGGRYDGLVSGLGGPDVPAVGFGLGLERIMLCMDAQGLGYGAIDAPTAYVASASDAQAAEAQLLAREIRRGGASCVTDLVGRSLKAQMRHADKLGAKFAVFVGEEELKSGEFEVRRMSDGAVRRATRAELATGEIFENV